jgi:hypothetical protein
MWESNMNLRTAAFGISCLVSLNIHAGVINNGDFETGDFSGWNTDVDFGDFGGNDFSVLNAGGNNIAAIQIDAFSTPGDFSSTPLTDGFFVNTLSQGLDLSGALGSTFELSFDLAGLSEATSAVDGFFAESYLVGLSNAAGEFFGADGSFGSFLTEGEIDGLFEESFSFDLADSFTNASDWTLEIQLFSGADPFTGFTDSFFSTLFVDNVTLTEVALDTPPTNVSAPSAFALLGLGLAGLAFRRNTSK